ncbi:hypothetical protein KVR01_001113 [Diaporthe batatas]|uniref:uncharacterized protein n=1 Tax=Diaporthe batatas TaxID=748121 RepID=UPI001D045D7C|nr:uncharacterized protein KVR01_001113 [Diaporthe batatas]KAG8168364.1 hypothetical protein KVR01_001113 [Diaporthe batatas]
MKLQVVLFAISAVCVSAACPAGKRPKPSPSAAPTTASDAALKSEAPVVAAVAAAPSSDDSNTSSSSSSLTNVLSAAAVSGTSTFYGGNLNGGACSFTTMSVIPSGLYGTAFPGSAWNNAAKCGTCLEVTGPNGKIKVMVVDKCPECEQGHLDLFQDGFAKIGSIPAGRIATSYTEIPCGISSPIVLHNKSGTSAYWFSMQVVNSNMPVSKLEVSTDGGKTWQATTRTDYNFFEKSSGFGTSTVDVRVTSTSGSTITVSKVSVASDSKATAASNFA